jgi:glutathione S-transferase
MSVVLHQFSHSHFNEKARWALAWKKVEHERRTYLPGPHVPAIRRLSGGTQTPVLVADGRTIAGSAAIVEFLESTVPTPALLPADPRLRSDALDFARQFDEAAGPAARAALFSVVLDHGGYFCAIFADQHGSVARAAYRAAFPLARPIVARANKAADAGDIARAFETVDRSLDDLATRIASRGHVIGDTFTVADLTAAALLAPLAGVEHADMALPQPAPESVRALLARYAPHPAIRWVNAIYRRYR